MKNNDQGDLQLAFVDKIKDLFALIQMHMDDIGPDIEHIKQDLEKMTQKNLASRIYQYDWYRRLN